MSDFIREVDEEFRHDQFRRFLGRRWPLLLAAVVLVLAGVGGWRAYDYVRTEKAQDAGGRYLDALNLQRDGKTEEAAKAFAGLARDAPPGYVLLARFSGAAATGRSDPAAGAALFDGLAADGAVEPALQNLARLRAALLLVDTASYPDLKTRLTPLADANNGLRNSARELLALSALKINAAEDAGRWLDAIQTDPTASAGLRQRAGAMMSLVRAGSGDAVVSTAAPVAASVIPGLTLSAPSLPAVATPFGPADGGDATQAPDEPEASPGTSPPIPAEALPAPPDAAPPPSDTVPNAVPPK